MGKDSFHSLFSSFGFLDGLRTTDIRCLHEKTHFPVKRSCTSGSNTPGLFECRVRSLSYWTKTNHWVHWFAIPMESMDPPPLPVVPGSTYPVLSDPTGSKIMPLSPSLPHEHIIQQYLLDCQRFPKLIAVLKYQRQTKNNINPSALTPANSWLCPSVNRARQRGNRRSA